MTFLLTLFVLFGGAAVTVRIGLGVLAQRRGVTSRVDACSYAGAMLIPLPWRTADDLVRIAGRRLGGLRYATPAGKLSAYSHVELRVGTSGIDKLMAQNTVSRVEADLGELYAQLARKHSWQPAPEGTTLTVLLDDRLADGRLFLDGRWAPTPTDRDAYSTSPQDSLYVLGSGTYLYETDEAVAGGTSGPNDTGELHLAEVPRRQDTVLLPADPPELTVVTGGSATVVISPALAVTVGGLEHLLAAGQRYLLGRDTHCDVVIDDPAATRRHAEVCHSSDAWWLRDLGSRNGTRLNGLMLEASPVRLAGPVTVEIGWCELRLEPTTAAAQSASAKHR